MQMNDCCAKNKKILWREPAKVHLNKPLIEHWRCPMCGNRWTIKSVNGREIDENIEPWSLTNQGIRVVS